MQLGDPQEQLVQVTWEVKVVIIQAKDHLERAMHQGRTQAQDQKRVKNLWVLGPKEQ